MNTSTPSDGEPGAVDPSARRTVTPARSASGGFAHDNPIEVVVTPDNDSPVTGPGGVVSGTLAVVATAVTGADQLPATSRVNTANAYPVPAGNPDAEAVVLNPENTSTPADGVTGGVLPSARRTTTPARSASIGNVHASPIDDVDSAVTASPVTGAGANLSTTGIHAEARSFFVPRARADTLFAPFGRVTLAVPLRSLTVLTRARLPTLYRTEAFFALLENDTTSRPEARNCAVTDNSARGTAAAETEPPAPATDATDTGAAVTAAWSTTRTTAPVLDVGLPPTTSAIATTSPTHGRPNTRHPRFPAPPWHPQRNGPPPRAVTRGIRSAGATFPRMRPVMAGVTARVAMRSDGWRSSDDAGVDCGPGMVREQAGGCR